MFVIPMVGLSTRFFKAGYTLPKYQLPLWGATVFTQVMRSFKNYYETDEFLFLCRDDHDAHTFISTEIKRLGLKNYRILSFEGETRGQAETVCIGMEDILDEIELFIFNIDTIRPNFLKPDFLSSCDGYLEVFEGDGDHWSFVVPGEDNNVISTTEKDRVSNFCSDGLYFFKKKSDLIESFRHSLAQSETIMGEFYVAPLYNYLISKSKIVKYHLISKTDVIFCGTPAEYLALDPLRCNYSINI